MIHFHHKPSIVKAFLVYETVEIRSSTSIDALKFHEHSQSYLWVNVINDMGKESFPDFLWLGHVHLDRLGRKQTVSAIATEHLEDILSNGGFKERLDLCVWTLKCAKSIKADGRIGSAFNVRYRTEDQDEFDNFESACNGPPNWFEILYLVTWSRAARSSAIRFLEFMSACPHWGQSTRRLLQSSQSKCPSGHW